MQEAPVQDSERAVGEQLSALPQLSGERNNPAGPSKSRCGESAGVYPPRRICQRNVEGKAPWRALDMTNLPCSQTTLPETMSGRSKGVRHFPQVCWFGDMVSTRIINY